MIKISDVIKDLKESQAAKYHRGKSWEYCYKFFRNYRKLRNDDELLDHAALHLAFFLASWGMLRGSSFLLQKDYKFFIPIIEILINQKYDKLWDFNFSGEIKEQDIALLFDLKGKLEKKIKENNEADGDDEEHEMDLIITKIIMATMGCSPSYDTYFKAGLKNIEKRKLSNFTKDSFRDLINLSKKDKELRKIYRKDFFIKGTNIKYPPMRLLDLYFWLLGSKNSKN